MEAVVEFVMFLVASVLIARALERAKFHVAMVAHAIVFTLLLAVFFFGSDLPLLAASAKGVVGEDAYEFIHEVLSTYKDGIHLSFSAFFALEIAVLVSVLAIVTLALIKGYRDMLKDVRGTRFLVPERVFAPLSDEFLPAQNAKGNRRAYLALGQLRI